MKEIFQHDQHAHDAQHELRLEEQPLRNLLNKYVPALIFVDDEGHVVYYNQQAISYFKKGTSTLETPLKDLLEGNLGHSIQIQLSLLKPGKEGLNEEAFSVEWPLFDEKLKQNFHLKMTKEEGTPQSITVISIQKANPDKFYTLNKTKQDYSTIVLKSNKKNEKDKKYQAIFDNTLDGIALSDFESTRAVECNQQLADMFGVSQQEIIEGGVLKFSPKFQPDGRSSEESLNEIRAELTGKGSGSKVFIWQYKRRGGAFFDAEVVVSLLEIDDRKVWLNIVRDISIRMESERALQKSARKLGAIFENTFNGTFLLSKDGRIEELNATAIKMFGVELQEVKGKAIWDIAWWSSAELAAQQLKTAVMDAANNELVRFDSKFLDESQEDRTVDFSLKQLTDEDGNIIQLILEGRDVTELVEVKEKITQNEELLRSVIRNTPGMTMLVFDKDLKFVLVEGNHVGMFGYTEEQIIGKTLGDLIPFKILADSHTEKYMNALNGETIVFEEPFGKRHYHVRIIPIRKFDGRIEQSMVIVHDMTEIKKNEHQLEQSVNELELKGKQMSKYIESNSELEDFAFTVSHDLKEPLRTMIGFSEVIQKQYSDHFDEQGKEYMDLIISGTKRMNLLITNLLEYSKVNSGGFVFRSLNPRDVFLIATTNLNKAITEHGVEIKIEQNIPEQIVGSHFRLAQVFQNLISNSIKFRQLDKSIQPVVRIYSIPEPNLWHFAVSDNGIGIAKKDHQNVFTLFKKIHKKGREKGTGIGLAICKRIVAEHKGKIWIESDVNKGATFHITLCKELKPNRRS